MSTLQYFIFLFCKPDAVYDITISQISEENAMSWWLQFLRDVNNACSWGVTQNANHIVLSSWVACYQESFNWESICVVAFYRPLHQINKIARLSRKQRTCQQVVRVDHAVCTRPSETWKNVENRGFTSSEAQPISDQRIYKDFLNQSTQCVSQKAICFLRYVW